MTEYFCPVCKHRVEVEKELVMKICQACMVEMKKVEGLGCDKNGTGD